MTGSYYAIPVTHGGNDWMQATKWVALMARLDTEHQPTASRDLEIWDRLAPLAASDEFPVGWVWLCIYNGMRITPMRQWRLDVVDGHSHKRIATHIDGRRRTSSTR